ncbi:Uncharacterised protein [Streptococcus pneumoniae]|nr:Uncharacterised protein [Streptococcus pneumoniae]CKG27666.1 Uncharacterised protein [Streptococcus pneumoniae]
MVSLTSGLIPSPRYSLGKAIFIPLMSWPIFEVKSAMRTGAEVESLASSLAIALSKRAFSLTVGAKGPIWSNELPKAMRPKRETVP